MAYAVTTYRAMAYKVVAYIVVYALLVTHATAAAAPHRGYKKNGPIQR